jgi:hypothetical protein
MNGMRVILRLVLLALALVSLCGTALGEDDAAALAQAERVYYTQYAEMATLYGSRELWTLEQKAQLDRLMLEAGFWDRHRSLPTEEDMPQEAALAIAKQAVLQEGSMDEQMLESFAVYTDFWTFTDESIPSMWDFLLHSPENLNEYGSYRVQINSPSGEIVDCRWQAERPYSDLSQEEKPAFLTELTFKIW